MVVGAVAGLVSVLIAAWSTPAIDVVAQDVGGSVVDVLPGGFAWYDGIRPGQKVLEVVSVDDPAGWRIRTESAGSELVASLDAGTHRLRDTLPLAILAATLGVAGVAAYPRHQEVAGGLGALALGAGAISFLDQGALAPADIALGLAIGVPTYWLGRWVLSGTVRAVVVVVAIFGGLLWIAARAVDPDAFPLADAIAMGLRLGLAGSILAALGAPIMIARLGRLDGIHATDLVAGSLAIVALLGTAVWAPSALPVTIGVAVLLGIAYPRGRRAVGEAIDRLIVADLRDRLVFAATEEERARLARDLHDAPLQELSGVIHRMELSGTPPHELGPLRNIADELRSMATDLYPPVLEDLGLGPALEALATDHESGVPAVTVEIANEAGYRRTERPPQEVEVAVFRIVQEATRNAVRHSGGSRVIVHGTVASDAISLEVEDDGVGLRDEDLRVAVQRGRLGVVSMRQRITSINGQISFVRANPTGLRVVVRWPS